MHYLYDTIHNYSDKQYLDFFHKLTVVEKNRLNLLVRDNDKKLFLLSRMLLSLLINKYFFVNYFNLNIKYNKYGKPLVDGFYFSIAHSYEYAVGVCSYHKIGVDIEKIRNVDRKMIDYFCSEVEKEYIFKSNNINKAFFEIFCLKEAYFKMIGTSLLKFRDVEFFINNCVIKCKQDDCLNIFLNYDVEGYIITIIEEKG